MHFRHRGNNIQVVRSVNDPATGKAKSVPVGSINKQTLQITSKLQDSCTPTEIAEIQAWVGSQEKIAALRRELAARTLAESVALAVEWLATASDEDALQLANDVLPAFGKLRKAFKNNYGI